MFEAHFAYEAKAENVKCCFIKYLSGVSYIVLEFSFTQDQKIKINYKKLTVYMDDIMIPDFIFEFLISLNYYFNCLVGVKICI